MFVGEFEIGTDKLSVIAFEVSEDEYDDVLV